MRIELDSRVKSVSFAAGAALVAVAYVFWVQNDYRASVAAAELSQSSLAKAVALEPGNAEYRDMLGRFYLFALQDANKADSEFRAAVSLDKSSSRYWLDLASAKALLMDTTAQREALRNALRADPKTPKVAWEAGNFFLVDGNTNAALDSFKAVIENDQLSSGAALQLCWRATHDAQAILVHAMPAQVTPHLELLHLLAEQQQTSAAMIAWRALVALDQPYKVTDTMYFIDYLIAQRDINDAQEVWSNMGKVSASLRPSTADGNLVTNGGFDEEVIPGGFSWRIEPPATKTIRIDNREFHGSTASVAFTFEGPAFGFYGFSQLIPVKPHQMYELRVSAKSEEIQSAEGPRIIVQDAFSHTQLQQTAEWQGTHGWNEEQVMFTTGPDTKLLRIYLGRVTGAGLIRGTLWLDDFRLYER